MSHESESILVPSQPSRVNEEQRGGRAPDSTGLNNQTAAAERPAPVRPIVFFDGVCGMCNRFVDFVLPRDRERVFLFAPLQGTTAQARLTAADVQQVSTIVLIDEGGTHRRSKAVVRILCRLGLGWKITGFLLAMIPRPLRDLGYRLVARYRYSFFGKKETCRIPTPEERERFLS